MLEKPRIIAPAQAPETGHSPTLVKVAPPVALPVVKPTPEKPKIIASAVKPTPARPTGWRVQLGAFSKRALAEAAWKNVQVKQGKAVAALKPIIEEAGF